MTTTTTSSAMMLQAVKAMKTVFDVTVICTTDDGQADFWMDQLSSGICKDKVVLAVSEDWNDKGGAGNGLGTLYAWHKACALAQTKFGIDLAQQLRDGTIAAALYHTAGKGTRMAPLPASENNNKPGVKLPFPLVIADGSVRPLTVLEAVIRQTGIYAASRKGRLSVFWGDQVFLPSVDYAYTPTHHVDILCALGESAPTAEEWKERGLDKYGVIACLEKDGRTDAAQVEKVSHETATQMLSALGSIKQVGPSLGSFSVSAAFLEGLLNEFGKELQEKTDKLDTDPHFWMPMTLSKDSYLQLMKQKGTDEEESGAHYERMASMRAGFDMQGMGLFGAVNVGQDACWWDYGQLKLYSENTKLLLEESEQASLLKEFLGLAAAQHHLGSTVAEGVADAASYLFASKVLAGSVQHSLLTCVAAGSVVAENATIVNCAAKSIQAGKNSIVYNVIQDEIVVGDGEVVVGVTNEDGQTFLLRSSMDIDGGQAWKIKLDMNDKSFEEVHELNKNARIGEIAAKRQINFDEIAKSI